TARPWTITMGAERVNRASTGHDDPIVAGQARRRVTKRRLVVEEGLHEQRARDRGQPAGAKRRSERAAFVFGTCHRDAHLSQFCPNWWHGHRIAWARQTSNDLE